MTTREQLFLEAHKYYRLKEIPGTENNPVIMGWARDLGVDWYQGDETAWCSLFINWLCWKLDIERSGAMDARSWLKVGKEVQTPELGDLVVFWRESPDSWKGHVAIWNGEDSHKIYCLGGNQGNMVQVSPYPIERKLAYIRLLPLDIALKI